MPTLSELRRLLGPADLSVRSARSEVYYGGAADPARARLGLGMHDRGEEYIFADGRVHEGDLAGHERHFPAHLKVIRLPTVRIEAGRSWDVTASGEAWPGLNPFDEIYLLVRVDRLIVAPGSSIEVHGNIFVLDCGSIELDRGAGAAGDAPFEIRIGGTRHPAFTRSRVLPARDGNPGRAGADGACSTANRPVGTPFGPFVRPSPVPKHGLAGTGGTGGGDGTTGQNGGLCMLADLRLGALRGFSPASLRVVAQGGSGRPGGAGGDGGDGGKGGDGARSVDALGGLVEGGPGGPGGDGGDGGDGGRGGNGGLASNIFIQVRPGDRPCLDLRPLPSEGGRGGAPGRGGAGGPGGLDGNSASEAGTRAAAGRDGAAGRPGPSGKGRPPPPIHVFEVPG